ncbi:hypothetical protein C0Q70_21412 [Pomacea canaliculata]|uniref:Uncharacterized protein n=1 Tax=Pomacea canaliculata TaxID=400727 RepID=A0A2T7NCH2_POMCA|nr:uncharacterized protein LOC112555918 [Pomacea canaliculata]XP_025080289.1 uncharacterized protein LOC112555918 [Pomacea canaliculata]PVD18855.1 hypothetical protein C0Q70_21412 [Pomacea canaliculata]
MRLVRLPGPCVLLCMTVFSHTSMASGECVKAHKSIHFTVPGYITYPIHTNECRETVSSVISPVVSVNASHLSMFRRHYSTCCCGIDNTSLHEAELLSLDGRPSIILLYRRIEECVCVSCDDVSRVSRRLLPEIADRFRSKRLQLARQPSLATRGGAEALSDILGM